MELTVDTSIPARVVIGATGLAQLAQEIRTVLSTRKGSVPLDRDFGLDWSFLDRPVTTLGPRYVADVARSLEKYVPRVKVVEVTFKRGDEDGDGVVHPVVKVAIRKEFVHDFV